MPRTHVTLVALTCLIGSSAAYGQWVQFTNETSSRLVSNPSVGASGLGWSRKHLAAKFRHEIGLTPKTIARMARFNRVLIRARRRDPGSWAALAAECCYADQAHLVRDFKDFTGESPTAWQARLAGRPVAPMYNPPAAR
jgi:methylphosphotriester-DNA--protein-cysteine methyltransferase